MRAIILTACLLPYAALGLRDVWFHAGHRRVILAERLLHLAIGSAAVSAFYHALFGHPTVVAAALLIFALARGLDEFIFHHGLPAAESELHARTHLAFLGFVWSVMVADWIASGAVLR